MTMAAVPSSASHASPLAAGEIVTETINGWECTDACFHVVTARTPCAVTLAQIPSTPLVEIGSGGAGNYHGHVIPGPAEAVIPGRQPLKKRLRVVDGCEFICSSNSRSLFGSSFQRWDGRPVFVSRTD
jgi:hypothetical protein